MSTLEYSLQKCFFLFFILKALHLHFLKIDTLGLDKNFKFVSHQ